MSLYFLTPGFSTAERTPLKNAAPATYRRQQICGLTVGFVDRVFYRFVWFFIAKTDKNPTANAKVLSTGAAAHALIDEGF